MSEIAQAIANRQSEIDRLQAEIKALTDVEQIPPCVSAIADSPLESVYGEVGLAGLRCVSSHPFDDVFET